MPHCSSCSLDLSGRQTKFCSRQCKNNDTTNRHPSYVAQQRRGRKRKTSLVDRMGGCCSKCGYRRNFSALEFHHIVPSKKKFHLDLRSLSNRNWRVILVESAKCELLCSNCHKETHNPTCLLGDAGPNC